MPYIDVSDSAGGIKRDAPWRVARAMAAPGDRGRQARERTRAAKLMRGELRDPIAVAWHLVAGDRAGRIAATILEHMLALHAHHPPASKSWAFSLTRKNIQATLGLPLERLPATDSREARRGEPYAELHTAAARPNLSDRRLRQIWNRYAPVAHFWLAWETFEERYGPVAVTETGHTELSGIQVQPKPVGAIAFSQDTFPHFVALADVIFDRACAVHLRPAKKGPLKPLIDPRLAYRVVLPSDQRVTAIYKPAEIHPSLLDMVRSEAA